MNEHDEQNKYLVYHSTLSDQELIDMFNAQAGFRCWGSGRSKNVLKIL